MSIKVNVIRRGPHHSVLKICIRKLFITETNGKICRHHIEYLTSRGENILRSSKVTLCDFVGSIYVGSFQRNGCQIVINPYIHVFSHIVAVILNCIRHLEIKLLFVTPNGFQNCCPRLEKLPNTYFQ